MAKTKIGQTAKIIEHAEKREKDTAGKEGGGIKRKERRKERNAEGGERNERDGRKEKEGREEGRKEGRRRESGQKEAERSWHCMGEIQNISRSVSLYTTGNKLLRVEAGEMTSNSLFSSKVLFKT